MKMPNFPQVIGNLMLKLSGVPGLGFLGTYVISVKGLKFGIEDEIDDNLGVIQYGRDAIAGAGKDLGFKGFRRGAAAPPPRGGQHDEYYDEEGADYSSINMVEDDYPSGDDHVAYHDDDYQR